MIENILIIAILVLWWSFPISMIIVAPILWWQEFKHPHHSFWFGRK